MASTIDNVLPNPVPDKPKLRGAWIRFCMYASIALALAALNYHLWRTHLSRPLPEGAELEAPGEFTCDGPSDSLRATVFLPTMERPIPDGKSAIWCATLPMAWTELESAAKKPVRVAGAEETCTELSMTPKARLQENHYFATGGLVANGAQRRLRDEFARRFPKAKLPNHESLPTDGLMGYAYLEVALMYKYLFKHDHRPLKFREVNGAETPVHAFGLREEDKSVGGNSREQVVLLFREKGEFAVDLSHNTEPYQIILARLNRKRTLNDTLTELNDRCGKSKPMHLSTQAVMLVPSMNWRIDHRFKELNGPLVNEPLRVADVSQSIQFKMDRKGAYIISESSIVLPSNGHPHDLNPNYLLFDRPYLLVMRWRDEQQPFFLMWVDNAELLQRH